MLLRDIIDLNAAHGDGDFDSAVFVTPGEMVATPAAGCVTASKDHSAAETVEIGTELGVAEAKEGESSIPLAAMEAALMLDITVTFDAMAQTQEKLDKLRHQRITNLGKREVLPRPTECRYDKLKYFTGQFPTHPNREFFAALQGTKSGEQGNSCPDQGIPRSSAIWRFAVVTTPIVSTEPPDQINSNGRGKAVPSSHRQAVSSSRYAVHGSSSPWSRSPP
jgi:hypothetical protein